MFERGLVPKEYGKWFAESLDIRLSGTYNIYTVLGEEIVEELVERAGKFIKKIEELLKIEDVS